MNRDEATKIASAVNALRPDWGHLGIMQILGDERIRPRAFTDMTRVFVALALDADTRKPTRIFEQGDWWQAAAPTGPREHNTSAHIAAVSPDDCWTCSRPKASCALDNSHEYEMRNRREERASVEQIEQIKKQVRSGA